MALNKNQRFWIGVSIIIAPWVFFFMYMVIKDQRKRNINPTEVKSENRIDSVLPPKPDRVDTLVDYIKSHGEFAKYKSLQDEAEINYLRTGKKKYYNLFYRYDSLRVKWAKIVGQYERALKIVIR